MTTALKSICFVTAFLGIVTAGVCIWVIASPVKFPIAVMNWDGGDSAKVGIAVAVIMVLIGIAVCLVNLEKLFIFFVLALFVVLTMSIAFMSLAIKDHQDWKKIHDIGAMFKSGAPLSFSNNGYGRNRSHPTPNQIFDEDTINSIMTRLKIIAAVGAIDAVTMLVALIVFYMKRPKNSSRNVMQMERTL